MLRKLPFALQLGLLLALLRWNESILSAQPTMSQIRADEEVILFPVAASQSADGNNWIIPVHGWIFEPEEDDPLRNITLSKLVDELDEQLTPAETAMAEARLRPFLVDNERGKVTAVRLADTDYQLPPSDLDGHFQGSIEVAADKLEPLIADGKLTISAVTNPGDLRKFAGTVYCLPPTGVSVVSDIDDTIKASNVRNKIELLANTFLREFKPIDGMSDVYRRWHESGAHFHYISASPWQLYVPLTKFLRDNGFAAGDFHLKRFRVKDSSYGNMLTNPLEYKLSAIELLLKRFPKRQFILVGDAGERDPEVYATFARRYPEQILRIYIRDTIDQREAPRYHEIFRDVPREKWQVFENPSSIEHLPGQE
jgi:hypothetical protein